MPGPRKLLSDERLALSKLDLKMNRMPSLSVIALSRLGGAQLQLLAFDHARAGDQEQGLVEPDFASEQLHAGAFSGGESTTATGCQSPRPFVPAEIGRETARRRGFRRLTKTASKPIRAAPSMSVCSASPTASTASRGGLPARCSAWS